MGFHKLQRLGCLAITGIMTISQQQQGGAPAYDNWGGGPGSDLQPYVQQSVENQIHYGQNKNFGTWNMDPRFVRTHNDTEICIS
jgi:hypothetical protein